MSTLDKSSADVLWGMEDKRSRRHERLGTSMKPLYKPTMYTEPRAGGGGSGGGSINEVSVS